MDHGGSRTRHHASVFGVERSLYEQMAYYVDGTAMVGPRAESLDAVLADSWHREVEALLDDLRVAAAALAELDARRGTSDVAELARRVGELRREILQDEATGEHKVAAFTFDGPNGGRPILSEVTGEHQAVTDGTGETPVVPDPPVIANATGETPVVPDPPVIANATGETAAAAS